MRPSSFSYHPSFSLEEKGNTQMRSGKGNEPGPRRPYKKEKDLLDELLLAHERVFIFLFAANRSNHMELMGTDIFDKWKKKSLKYSYTYTYITSL